MHHRLGNICDAFWQIMYLPSAKSVWSCTCHAQSATAGTTGSCACTGSASGNKSNLTDRFAGNLRKAIGIPAKDPAVRSPAETEAVQAAAQSAEALVQVALAAFAVSAYIRSSLCPMLQSYEPQAKLPSLEVKLSAPASLVSCILAYHDVTGYHVCNL